MSVTCSFTITWKRGSESKADHPQPCSFGLNFGPIIRALPHFGKTAPPVAVQRTFNARLLKNSLSAEHCAPATSSSVQAPAAVHNTAQLVRSKEPCRT